VATDAKRKDFTWAKYRQAGAEIIVASKERSGKADLIAFVLPGKSTKSDQTLFEELNARNGLGRTEKLSPVSKSVRYLPSGRLEISTSKAGGLKFVSIPMAETADHAAAQMVVISRLPQEPEDFLRSHQADNDVLKGLSLGNAPG
ncbi:MAG: hypothetical protein K2X81_07800, partial [Candidatus Obscuribacterales bacterium]|nr:hypothetical protein [Candidatus Obscuribacterales bacterium]